MKHYFDDFQQFINFLYIDNMIEWLKFCVGNED